MQTASPHPTTCRSSIHASIHPMIYPCFVHACIHAFIHASIHPIHPLHPFNPSMHASIYPSVRLCMHVFTCVCLQSKQSAFFIEHLCKFLRLIGHLLSKGFAKQISHKKATPAPHIESGVNFHKWICPQDSCLAFLNLSFCLCHASASSHAGNATRLTLQVKKT